MPITITDSGRNNIVNIAPDVLRLGSGKIVLQGDDNVVNIESPILLLSILMHVADGSSVTIGRNVHAGNLFIHAVRSSKVVIGSRVGFNGQVRLLLHEPGEIAIGDDCLFGGEVDISISDMHSILDADTNERLNPARDILIGRHVWVGQRCLVLKGAGIGDDSVIGAGSLVSSRIPAKCLAAGNPARIIKVNINWDQRLL